MSRRTRRLTTVAATAVSALGAAVVLAAPAQAAISASLTWYPGPDYAVIQLDHEAVSMAAEGADDYALVDLCGQIGGAINTKRQAAGYGVGLEQSACVAFVVDCVSTRRSDSVQITVYADLTYRCGSYA